MRFRAGLIVGKFCPLHRGHQFLIETARAACDRLIVISYAKPGFAGYERNVRDQWLGSLYPDVVRLVVDDDWLTEYRAGHGDCPWLRVPHDDEPETSIAASPHGCAGACSARRSRRSSPARTMVTVSPKSSAIGSVTMPEQPTGSVMFSWTRLAHGCRFPVRKSAGIHGDGRISSIRKSRASFVRRIAVLGGESTGKTTLCAALADRLVTAWVPEYGRALWLEKDGNLELSDMLRIGRRQIEHEEEAMRGAQRWLICDTTPLTTVFYSEAMFGAVDSDLVRLAERRYDHILLCMPDFEFFQDGTRQDAIFRDRQHDWYMRSLCDRGIAFSTIGGLLEDRVDQAVEILENLSRLALINR